MKTSIGSPFARGATLGLAAGMAATVVVHKLDQEQTASVASELNTARMKGNEKQARIDALQKTVDESPLIAKNLFTVISKAVADYERSQGQVCTPFTETPVSCTVKEKSHGPKL
jgi:hypothetical protein